MPGCCVPNCKNRSEQGFRLFPIPRGKRSQEKTKAWTKFVNRGELPFRASICETHFEKNQFETGRADNRTLLKWNDVPTIGVHEHQRSHKRKAIDNCDSIHEADSSLKLADHVGEASAGNEDDFVQNLQFQQLKNKLKNALQKIASLESQIKKMEERYNDIFNEDQLKFLKYGTDRGEEWLDHTINKGLKLYMACGAKGYEEIRKQGLPYPSIRTLQYRIQNFKFDADMLEDVLNLLRFNVSSFKSEEKHAALLLDEMAIHPGLEYDHSLKKIIGRPTMKLSGNEDSAEVLATHALVFMLAGISSRWKQTVGYEFTAASYSAEEVLDKIFHLIRRAHEIGITITTVITDMGPQNRSVWRILNVNAHRHSEIKNFCKHPIEEHEKLYIIPDPVHIYKNIAGSLLKHKIFYIDKQIVEKYDLPSSCIDVQAINNVYDWDCNKELKVALKIKQYMFDPNHFQKMNVNTAYALLHHSTAAVISYYITKDQMDKTYRTTAWFIYQLFKWFSIMTGRHSKMGLSEKNMEKHNETVQFLKEFMDITRSLTVKNKWMPFQSGLMLASKTALDLEAEYVQKQHFQFLLLGRFTQDAIENLFSVIRSRRPIPGAKDFKTALRLITLAQYESQIVHGNYFVDQSEHSVRYCKNLNVISTDSSSSELIVCDYDPDIFSIDADDECLYYVLGNVLSKVKKCSDCYNILIEPSSTLNNFSLLTKLKCYKENILVFPSISLFQYIRKAEVYFQSISAKLLRNELTCETASDIFTSNYIFDIDVPKCHNIIINIVRLFLRTRFFFALREYNKKNQSSVNITECANSSKSVATRILVNNIK